MILAPRSWPSRPGLATRMRTLRVSAIFLQQGNELRRLVRQRGVGLEAPQGEPRAPRERSQLGGRIVSDDEDGRKLRAVGQVQPLRHPVDSVRRIERALLDDPAQPRYVLGEALRGTARE